MFHNDILLKTCDILETANVTYFPINCFELLDKLGIKYIDYNSLNNKKKNACKMLSNDAFVFRNTIYYDGSIYDKRLRFSLMHELGHIVLDHGADSSSYEEHEADYFASNLLAPEPIVNYAELTSANEISKLFGLSRQAANIVLNRDSSIVYSNLYTSRIFNKFYNKLHRKIIFHFEWCSFCTVGYAFNKDNLCDECKKSLSRLDNYEYMYNYI